MEAALPPNINFAVSNSDIEHVEFLLSMGHCANARDDDKTTPLHIAAFKGRIDICTLLLAHGAKINAEDYVGRTPILMAQSQSRKGVVKYLLEKGANPNITTVHGDTPLSLAISKNDCDSAKLLIDHGAYLGSEESAFRFLRTAVILGSLDLVQLLIPFCDLAEVEEISTVRPLCLAAALGELEIARHLLEKGSKITETSHETGESPLHLFLRRIRDGTSPAPSLPFFLSLVKLLDNYGFDFGTACASPSKGESVTSFNLRRHLMKPEPAIKCLELDSLQGFKELLVIFGSPFEFNGPEFVSFHASNSRSLKSFSRAAARRHLGCVGFIQKVKRLDLPRSLKYFLLFSELWGNLRDEGGNPLITIDL